MITEHEPAGRRALPPLSDKHRHTHEVGSAIAPDILDNKRCPHDHRRTSAPPRLLPAPARPRARRPL